MPELPEVEVVRAGLEKQLVGALLNRVEVFHLRTLRGQDPKFFRESLRGWKITAVVRRGKFIWVLGEPQTGSSRSRGNSHDGSHDASQGRSKKETGLIIPENPNFGQMAILVHLGMSGQMLVKSAERPDELGKLGAKTPKHLRVRWELWHPQRKQQLVVDFVDQRTFGRMQLVKLQPTIDAAPGGYGSVAALIPRDMEKSLARDALDPNLDWECIVKRVRASHRAIKNILLDQAIVSGIGNIYADEALFAAKIHPRRRGCGLSKKQVEQLYLESAQVMRRALAEGGTSFDSLYLNTDGNPGYFARSLQVYGRRGEPCLRCGTVISQIQLGGRSATFCDFCQSPPRSY